MERLLPVPIYADTTGQYTEDDLDAMEFLPFGQVLEIPVPESLLKAWWYECLQFDREESCQEPEGGWPPVTDDDFYAWVFEESTADDCDSLYDWLTDHNYYWRRLD